MFIDLRPIEEFRHTPIIPISERDLADHKRKIDEANRKGYYVEIKKDTLYFYCTFVIVFNAIVIATLSLGIIGYMFLMVNERQMQMQKDIDRTRMLRLKASAGKKGGNILQERGREDLTQGRSMF